MNINLFIIDTNFIQTQIQNANRAIKMIFRSKQIILIKADILILKSNFVSHFVGNGSAIQVETEDYVHHKDGHQKLSIIINETTFLNNLCKSSGGSIYFSKYIVGEIANSLFTINSSLQVNKMSSPGKHLFIFSMSDLKITGSTFVYKPPESTFSQSLLHLATTLSETRETQKEFYHFCPLWFYTAIEPKYDKYQEMISFTTFCRTCSDNFYTVYSQFLIRQSHDNKLSLLTVDAKTISKTLCMKCPYGALCSKGKLTAKPRFWGTFTTTGVAFYLCPSGYCCTGLHNDQCNAINSCASNRYGALCGSCKKGFSLSMMSSSCLPNYHCKAYWFWVLIVLAALAYMLWYTIKDLLFGLISKLYKHVMLKVMKRFNKKLGLGEDLGYISILMYYIQVHDIMVFDYQFSSASKTTIQSINNIFSNILNFRIFDRSLDICAMLGLESRDKLIFRTLFPYAIVFLWLFAYILKNASSKMMKNDCFQTVLLKGLAEIIKYNYGMIISASFNALNCIHIQNKKVWFYDSNIECLTMWQKYYLIYDLFIIFPFPFVCILGLRLLESNIISYSEFLLGCFFPLPYSGKWCIQFLSKNSSQVKHFDFNDDNSDNNGNLNKHSHRCKSWDKLELNEGKKRVQFDNFALSLRNVILDAFEGPFIKKGICRYWEGVLEVRRFLISLTLFIINPQLRIITACILSIFILVHHVFYQPYKEKIANIIEMFSLVLLIYLGLVNWGKAFVSENGLDLGGKGTVMIEYMISLEDMSIMLLILMFILGHICRTISQK